MKLINKIILSWISILMLFAILKPFLCSAQNFDGTNFSSDKPFYGTPPYKYENSQIYFITIKTSPDVAKALVPAPLAPISDGIISFIFAKFQIVSPVRFDYEEFYFTIPVSFNNIIGGYQPALYLSKIESILPGREIWGYNKTLADIKFKDENNIVLITVSRMDTVFVKASFTLGDPLPPPEQKSSPYTYFHKYIPSAEKGQNPDVNQIILGELTNTKTTLFRPGKASLDLSKTQYDPFDKIPILGIINAGYLEKDFVLDYGKIAYDFNKGK